MKKVRILHVSTAHPSQDPRLAYRVIPSLAPHYELIAALPHVSTGHKYGVNYLWLPKFRRVWLRILFSQPFVLWYALCTRPKLLHLYDPELLPLARFIQILLRIPVIYEVHENLYKKSPEKAQNQGAIVMQLFYWFDAMAQRRFYLIFTEHAYLDTYRQLANAHVIIYNYPLLSFLETFRQPYDPDQEQPAFFYIGWMSVERAFDTLVAGLSILKKTHPKFQAHFFGERTFTDNDLNQLPGFTSIQDNIHFYGYTDQQQALPYASRSTAGFALLKAVGDYPDSYTTKMFEYMALGLPVITSNFALYRHVVEQHQCGFCIDPTDPKQLAEVLTFLIEHPDESRAMGERGRVAVKNYYNWESEAQKLLGFYETVLNQS
ncbi:glycosyltransferase family 4 protein [Spirosoma aureum]|uniref:Glycosyltransferase family 4 protein n=1 Tax=Spirosoma aureum TaxID=2692134 RepID=A0A6G9AIA8_9BACT|nr:glycosyltransferase [Spirosoma aureum]QIP12015.1 glycosyltransferase family 4 protein [Spirosoma aureum]